jgi:hypothetical protein
MEHLAAANSVHDHHAQASSAHEMQIADLENQLHERSMEHLQRAHKFALAEAKTFELDKQIREQHARFEDARESYAHKFILSEGKATEMDEQLATMTEHREETCSAHKMQIDGVERQLADLRLEHAAMADRQKQARVNDEMQLEDIHGRHAEAHAALDNVVADLETKLRQSKAEADGRYENLDKKHISQQTQMCAAYDKRIAELVKRQKHSELEQKVAEEYAAEQGDLLLNAEAQIEALEDQLEEVDDVVLESEELQEQLHLEQNALADMHDVIGEMAEAALRSAAEAAAKAALRSTDYSTNDMLARWGHDEKRRTCQGRPSLAAVEAARLGIAPPEDEASGSS